MHSIQVAVLYDTNMQMIILITVVIMIMVIIDIMVLMFLFYFLHCNCPFLPGKHVYMDIYAYEYICVQILLFI
uniref:Uncharacterized protein n=1 Tax=Anguilla anguilla TaxID=7936 RepID=A0A0E9XL09_ANGAN